MGKATDRVRTDLVLAATPAPRDAWEEVFRADPLALETQSPAWTDAICAWSRYEDASRLYVGPDGRRLVLPMLRRSLPGRAVAVEASPPPRCGVGGVLAPGGASAAEIAAILAGLPDGRVLRCSFSPNPLLASEWAAAVPPGAVAVAKRGHMLDLEGGFEHVWSKRYTPKTRTRIRKAERKGVTAECDTSGRLVPVFHELMTGAVGRWARRQHEPLWLAHRRLRYRAPLEKFEAIARVMSDRCRLWVARVDARPVAASLVLQGANAYGLWAAMDEGAKDSGATGLLISYAIEDACTAGCRYFYMGESGWSDTHAVFKERFGARPAPYADYHLERLPITSAENAVKRMVKQMIRFKD